jgi:penicillin-binding protein 1C
MHQFIKSISWKLPWIPIPGLILIYCFWIAIPTPLFDTPLSTILVDKEDRLLNAQIASDGQWRFPYHGELPETYRTALRLYEDRNFFIHPGFDPIALIRASFLNFKYKKRISGGSTLTMQTVSLSRGRKSKHILDKLTELFLAFRIEISYSKKSIMQLYAANAPFGGNVVGIDAASWRYFNKAKSSLSWAEAALLAVLPNNPALIHPGRNREQLKIKRDRLLWRLHQYGYLSEMDLSLSMDEPIPIQPIPLPQWSPHLLHYVQKNNKTDAISKHFFKVSIDLSIQQKVHNIVQQYHQRYTRQHIHNIAVLVINMDDGKVLSYLGNSAYGQDTEDHAGFVDIIQAPRSPGSLLKPFLYNWALEDGLILPHSLLSDVPVFMSGFRPENYHKQYVGAIPAHQALSRSLNIPFALLLKEYGVDKLHRQLKQLSFQYLHPHSDHHGLALILGGVETTLWELSQAFRLMGLAARNKEKIQGLSVSADNTGVKTLQPTRYFHPGAAWWTLEAMSGLERPGEHGQWRRFQSAKKISWKTGTSHGYRDAWTIGMNANYLIGVWVGNASGEGRPGIIGIEAAAPIFFDIFKILSDDLWFEKPNHYLQAIEVCAESGYLPNANCPTQIMGIPKIPLISPQCTFHKSVPISENLAPDGQENVITHRVVFELPPTQAYYFQKVNPGYRTWEQTSSLSSQNDKHMQWIYPKPGMILQLSAQSTGLNHEALLSIAHNRSNAKVFWFLDSDLMGITTESHQLKISPPTGSFILTCTDEYGNSISQQLRVVRD